MQYAEDFELPDGHSIITTRDHPFCTSLEPCFKTAIKANLLREHNNADVAVICKKPIEESLDWEKRAEDHDLYIVTVRVRRILFNVISPAIGDYDWQNGFIADPGLLHGGMAHRVYDVCRHRTVAVLGCYLDKETAGALVTQAGIKAQTDKIKGRYADEILCQHQHAWQRQFHKFRKSVQARES